MAFLVKNGKSEHTIECIFGLVYNHSQNIWDKVQFSCDMVHYGKVEFLFFRRFLLVLTKFSFCMEELALGNNSMKFWDFPDMSTYSRQKFSGLSWMVKRYYIQDYPESFRGNTETRTIASDLIRPSIESSLTRRGKKAHRSDMWWKQVAFYK